MPATIATVSLARLFDNCQHGRHLNQELQNNLANWQQKIARKKEDLAKKRETLLRLDKKRQNLEQLNPKQQGRYLATGNEIQLLEIELESLHRQTRVAVEAQLAEARRLLAAKAGPIIRAYAKQKQLLLVKEESSPDLYFADESIDITEKIIERFDKAK